MATAARSQLHMHPALAPALAAMAAISLAAGIALHAELHEHVSWVLPALALGAGIAGNSLAHRRASVLRVPYSRFAVTVGALAAFGAAVWFFASFYTAGFVNSPSFGGG